MVALAHDDYAPPSRAVGADRPSLRGTPSTAVLSDGALAILQAGRRWQLKFTGSPPRTVRLDRHEGGRFCWRHGAGFRRDRTMVFRLSQDEYESLMAATTQSGGRSVSDFIRTAVLSTIESGTDPKATPSRLRELEQRVRRLESAYLGLLKEGA